MSQPAQVSARRPDLTRKRIDDLPFWRKLLEHLLNIFVEFLRVFFRIARQIAARCCSPNQLFGGALEHAYDQRANPVVVNSCRRRDVIQPEATREDSKSKLPMFGDSFPR
jgi:hypothetical protein